ncbi:NUDIX hydrolase [Actinomarinicola tropica]|uniref:NUDIX hydrolase n=1 Tax=Actinomarinicola tropica TaxID=2789776 RepID=UPI001897C6B3|nr:NUDIX hydrolase [Actinomarinicola tropica]
MPPVLHRLLLGAFAKLPRPVRRRLVRWGAPSYTVGAICVIRRQDGRVLLIRQRYRQRWGLPGGLLSRGEDPADAARREVAEEVGLDVELIGPPVVVVDPGPQRVDVVYAAVPAPGCDPDTARPTSPEVVDARWFAPDAMDDVQHETASALAVLAERQGAGPESTGSAEAAGLG